MIRISNTALDVIINDNNFIKRLYFWDASKAVCVFNYNISVLHTLHSYVVFDNFIIIAR